MAIAAYWGLDLQIDRRGNIAEQLAEHLAQTDEAREIFSALSDDEQLAIQRIASRQGRVFWDQFTREFGLLREMGAARREKERPHNNPSSVTESLFYKGWIGRAFFESGHGIREFAFLPDEFVALFENTVPPQIAISPSPVENGNITPRQSADDRILDHACTLLSLLRSGLPVEEAHFSGPAVPPQFLAALLSELDLIKEGQVINPARVKSFLEAPRDESFSMLARAWMESRSINELDFLPGLECEGGWKNRPWENRADVLNWARALAGAEWYAMENFIAWVRAEHTDFLRSGGEYDTWIIRNATSGEFMRGQNFWDQVEGAYLRWMASGPLVWLGIFEIGKSTKRDSDLYVRASPWAESLLARGKVDFSQKTITIFDPDKHGKISIERRFPLQIRYQLARFCDFIGEHRDRYHYQISPASIKRSEQQGLKASQLVALLRKYGRKPLPQNILEALEAWEQRRQSAHVHSAIILDVPDSRLMEKILASPGKKYILERLSSTTASVARNSIPALRALLLELGILADIEPDG
jgi:hypothetical protein